MTVSLKKAKFENNKENKKLRYILSMEDAIKDVLDTFLEKKY